MKYNIQIFGCQMNQSDAQRIVTLLESMGFKKTDEMAGADIAVVVMCSVRQMAADRVFGLKEKINQAKKTNPRLKIILTGCVVESDKKYFSRIFDQILDIKDLPQWPKLLKLKIDKSLASANFKTKKWQKSLFCQTYDYFQIAPKQSSKFSALIPISNGCNNFCSYCVVPSTRGPLISRPAEDIIQEIKQAVASGAKEIWLLGQNVNNYHYQDIDFAKLLRIVNGIPGDFWVRFTSPHPKDFNDETILAIAQCQKITPYLNLPIQSGDDTILKIMKRPYTAAQYKTLIKKIRGAFKKYRQGAEKEVAISTDAIVGFCGETKKQFQNTAKIFKEIKYDMAYISRYSPRPGTTAINMEDNIADSEKKRREEILNDIVKITALHHNEKWRGKTVSVLVDCLKNGFAFGKDRHYKTVKIKINGNKIAPGDIIKTKIIDIMPFGLSGKI